VKRGRISRLRCVRFRSSASKSRFCCSPTKTGQDLSGQSGGRSAGRKHGPRTWEGLGPARAHSFFRRGKAGDRFLTGIPSGMRGWVTPHGCDRPDDGPAAVGLGHPIWPGRLRRAISIRCSGARIARSKWDEEREAALPSTGCHCQMRPVKAAPGRLHVSAFSRSVVCGSTPTGGRSRQLVPGLRSFTHLAEDRVRNYACR